MNKKSRHTKGRDIESRGTTQFAPPVPIRRGQSTGPLEGYNGANRPTLNRIEAKLPNAQSTSLC